MSSRPQVEQSPDAPQLTMPVVEPLPIRTRGVAYPIALWRWITTIRGWKLIENWEHRLPDQTGIVIPKDFEFDGASIPRIFWVILAPTGLLLIPGLVHDFGYRYDYLLQHPRNGGPLEEYKKGAGRRYWDDLFRDVAININGFKIINRIAWLALRVGGWLAWGKRRREAREPYWLESREKAVSQAAPSA